MAILLDRPARTAQTGRRNEQLDTGNAVWVQGFTDETCQRYGTEKSGGPGEADRLLTTFLAGLRYLTMMGMCRRGEEYAEGGAVRAAGAGGERGETSGQSQGSRPVRGHREQQR